MSVAPSPRPAEASRPVGPRARRPSALERLLGGLLALLCLTGSSHAADLSASQQSLLFLRVLAYDRNLKTRASDGVLSVAVIYRAGRPESEQAREALLGALGEISSKKVSVAGLPIRAVPIEFTSASAIDSKLRAAKVSAVYVCPGLGDATGVLAAITRKYSILSGTATEAAVRSGLSVGVVAREGKPGILINLPAARAEGADFDAALLRLAEVIR